VRRYSPERFVAEVAAYKKQRPLTFVYIFDDTFSTSREWLSAFCQEYTREVNLPFFVNFTAGMVTPERIAMLRQAGLVYVGVGLESGDQDIRRHILKKDVTNEELEQAAYVLHDAKIPFEFYNMLAFPGTTVDHDLATLEMNARLRPDVPEVMIFQPYPGTPLGDDAARMGLFSGNPDDLPPTFKDRTVLDIPNKKQVRRLFLLFRVLVYTRSSKGRARFLSSLPLTPIYWLANRLAEGFVKSRYIYKIRVPWRDYLTVLYHYFQL